MKIAPCFWEYVQKANDYYRTENKILSNLRQQPVIWKEDRTIYKCLATLYNTNFDGIPLSVIDNPVILPLEYEEMKSEENNA
jgi:hypothetical protein